MQYVKKEYKRFNKTSYRSFILGGDIGGTNTNLGIFGVKNKSPTLLLSFHFKSKELKGLHEAINMVLKYMQGYRISITKASIGAAGVLSTKKELITVTNLKWHVNKKSLIKKTKLKKIILLNDFEAIGYGVNTLSKKDVKIVKKAKKIPKAPIVVIGAGTGFGKTTLFYNDQHKSYIPMPSEGGHIDFAPKNKDELGLANFIKKYRRIKQSISYQQVLSGSGLENIYVYLRKRFNKTKYTKEIDKSANKAMLISKYRKVDRTCKAVFEIFKKFYGTAAKDYAVDALSYGGIYISGGIAAKNNDIFDKTFIKNFYDSPQMKEVVLKTPVYVILDYNIGLLGAGFAGARFL
ncbi:hypothetical protein CMO83_05225 [Candidatus Woesearchaeota archaeon]|jgi:glucokinase|nr:hypothetical protein [Candidatus Woesearchaeota archaeon]|tara:strand:- start:6617 stop:7663 length:1047 start_codon:yes stop_codon:yes gene_type:complete